MSDSIVIATVPKNGVEEVRVSLSAYQGHALLDIRTFADFGEGEDRKATKKGVSLQVRRLPELRAALEAAEAEARARGLLDRGGARG